MDPRTLRRLLSAASLVTLLTAGSACYVEDEMPPPEAPVAVQDGYEVPYYDGYVVYYDNGGRPFYYENGVSVWVPVTSPFYVGLTNHWHTYGPAYGRWYAHGGYRYHTYRRGGGGRRRR